MRVKILKPLWGKKIGEITDAKFPAGDEDEYIKNGFIEIIKDNDIYSELKLIVPLPKEDQDKTIEHLAKKFNKRPERIRQQLDNYIEERSKHGKKIFFDEPSVRRFYRFFRHEKPTEIRVFDKEKYPKGQSVFVTTEDEFVNKCRYYCEEEKVSVYIGARDRAAKGDANVISSSFLFFEIDEHGNDKSSEKEKIIQFLKDNNIPITMQGMSGGGWHFYIMHTKQKFANSEEAFAYKEQSLNSFKKVMQAQNFDIDGAVFNLERVTRVLGTYNYKRNKISTIEFIDANVDAEANAKALIELLKNNNAMPAQKPKETKSNNIDNDKFLKEVKDKWVEGDRQNLAICLAGYLRKKKRMGLNSVISIVQEICEDCGDTDVQERINGVRATFEKDETDIKGAAGLDELNIETNPQILAGKVPIELPGDNSYISVFAEGLVSVLAGKKIMFYRQDSRQVIELGDIKNKDGEITHTGFIPVTPGRFSTLIERYFAPWTYRMAKSGKKYMVEKSMTKNDGSIVLESKIIEEGLPSIDRIFTVQLPIIYKGELTFPKTGYDERFRSWLPMDCGKIGDMNMTLDEAKEILKEVYGEFCFESKQDYYNAISALLTPFLRGLFKTGFNTRAPIYCYEANRERSGKDFCAGVTGMIYEGNALEEAPISSGEYRASGGNDELRKKLISAMISGKKRLHFSNNKGHLNNAVFESVTTATRFTDRLLGKNIEVAFDNEMDFSFSGNLGMTLTPDLANRTVFIKLFLEIEDANERKFKRPNLHHWVLENKDKILSALYALVRNWFDKGCPDGTIPFASFPEWARVCGGIMETAGYGNPCKKTKNDSGISIDSETDEMKELFERCYEACPGVPMSKLEIKAVVQSNNIMPYINWDNRSAQTKFGNKLKKFKGRILSDIKMEVEDTQIRSTRWKYIFNKKYKPEVKKWTL